MSKPLMALAFMAELSLSGCFSGSEFPPDASEPEVRDMLAACHFKYRDFSPQSTGDSHLMVSIFENEPDYQIKQSCLEKEQDRRNVSIGVLGPLPAKPKGL